MSPGKSDRGDRGSLLEHFDGLPFRDDLAVDLVRLNELLGFLGVWAPRFGEDDNVVLGNGILHDSKRKTKMTGY